ncbi:MAG: hypothetical protein FWF77_00315, partial [Defluviitaleaceae bacterium]|nr:hypothetical protein [Defluviitaleaceae bacterium]
LSKTVLFDSAIPMTQLYEMISTHASKFMKFRKISPKKIRLIYSFWKKNKSDGFFNRNKTTCKKHAFL